MIKTVENDVFQYCAWLISDNGLRSSNISPKFCEKLKSIASRDITIKGFVNWVSQEKLDCVRVCLKSTVNEDIAINCLVKEIWQPLHGQ